MLEEVGVSEEDMVVDAFRMAEGAPCPMARLLYRVETHAIEREDEDEVCGRPESARMKGTQVNGGHSQD